MGFVPTKKILLEALYWLTAPSPVATGSLVGLVPSSKPPNPPN